LRGIRASLPGPLNLRTLPALSLIPVHRAEVVALPARYRVPTVYPWRYFTELGGLLSYGNEQPDSFRLAATYADRILKGEKPGELRVQAPVKFELVINMKAAEALGLDVPLRLQQTGGQNYRIDYVSFWPFATYCSAAQPW
jgi:ABC-type uncharacterized transport system substrate-binding protein